MRNQDITTQDIRGEFIELMGLAAQADGMARIAGRILGLLVFDGVACSFSDLATALQVSRGSISINARLLEQQGIIEKVAVPGDRQDYYRLSETPYANVLSGVCTRAERTSRAICRLAAALPAGEDGVAVRLAQHAAFYDTIVKGIRSASETE